ncbi:hypothetical protein QOT17_000575 [Balamuthia mandrillaris]
MERELEGEQEEEEEVIEEGGNLWPKELSFDISDLPNPSPELVKAMQLVEQALQRQQHSPEVADHLFEKASINFLQALRVSAPENKEVVRQIVNTSIQKIEQERKRLGRRTSFCSEVRTSGNVAPEEETLPTSPKATSATNITTEQQQKQEKQEKKKKKKEKDSKKKVEKKKEVNVKVKVKVAAKIEQPPPRPSTVTGKHSLPSSKKTDNKNSDDSKSKNERRQERDKQANKSAKKGRSHSVFELRRSNDKNCYSESATSNSLLGKESGRRSRSRTQVKTDNQQETKEGRTEKTANMKALPGNIQEKKRPRNDAIEKEEDEPDSRVEVRVESPPVETRVSSFPPNSSIHSTTTATTSTGMKRVPG